MTHRQSATILVLLAALYVAALVLLAPGLDFLAGESAFDWLVGVASGVVVASPAFVAIWAVHGRQRASVRLPLTAWLCAVFYLAATYGEVRYFGHGDADIVLLWSIAWLTASVTVLLLLRLLRAVRGWRLQRIDGPSTEIDSGQPDSAGRKRQFTIRTLLGWTSAAAALCAGLRWLAPYLDDGELLVQMLDGLLIEGPLFGLIFALAGLPVVSVAWIVLADGRRTMMRCVLAAITIAGIVGGAEAFRGLLDDVDILPFALAIEAGVLITGLAGALVVRACGYRLVRPNETKSSAGDALANLSQPKSRFAFTLAPLVMASLLLACYAPQRLEIWRRADEAQRWDTLGWHTEFDTEGRVTSLMSQGNCDLEGTESLISQVPHLTSLQISHGSLSDVLLPQFPPLTELESLILDGISDAGVSRLQRFPNLKTLALSGGKLTDVGLSHLTALRKLTTLYLCETSVLLEDVPALGQLESLNLQGSLVCDAGLSRLDRFPNLKSLNLVRTNVTDAGLPGLRALKSLAALNLQLTEVTDEAVATLSQLSQLCAIDLQLTAVSQDGFVELQKALPDASIKIGANDAMIDGVIFARVSSVVGFGNLVTTRGPQARMLTQLHARGNYPVRFRDGDTAVTDAQMVTDAGLALLSGQTAMEELDLRESGVTDAGLPSLIPLTSLKRLDLRGTQVTEAGCAELAKALPNCVIVR